MTTLDNATAAENITLGEFERRHGINKGTVSRAARTAGFTTNKGLSPDAYAAMKEHFEVSDQPAAPAAPAIAPEVLPPAPIDIYQGNHQNTLAAPDLSGSRDLGQLRSPRQTVNSYADPLALAQMVVSQNAQIVGAMSADLEQRQQQLDRTNEALSLVEQSNQNLITQAQSYQIEAAVQGAMLNQQTQALQRKVQQQQALGKPADGSQPPQS